MNRGSATSPPVPTAMTAPVEAAWQEYLAAIERCRQFIYTREFSDRQQINAEAGEFLMQAQSAAHTWIMAPRVDYPRFFVNTLTEPMVGTWFLPCPDFRHRMAFIDGAQTYRIRGRRSNARFLDFQLGPTGAEAGSSMAAPVSYPLDGFDLAPDGSFEIFASPDRHPGNWIQLDPAQERVMLLVREAFYDWSNETPASLRIERIAQSPPRPIQFDEAELIKHIHRAARYVEHVVRNFGPAIFDLALRSAAGEMNRFAWMHLGEGAPTNSAAAYSFMVYDVGPDEAVIIDSEVPRGRYWSVQLADRYGRSADFTYHQSSLNGHQMRVDGDGRFRAVIARRDPGVANWLDPVDIAPLGLVYFRQYFQQTLVDLPIVRKVGIAQLNDALPPDTIRVIPDERDRQLRERSWAMLSLYGH